MPALLSDTLIYWLRLIIEHHQGEDETLDTIRFIEDSRNGLMGAQHVHHAFDL
jgi:hypothetical protein